MKALVLGAGGVGRAIANIASRRSFITELVIADRNLSRAEDAVNRLKDPRFSAAQVNAAELEDIRELIRKANPDIVINAVDPRFVMPIFLACEIENKNYLDMAMSLSRPHPHYPYTETGVKCGDEQFARDWNWSERGIYALIGMGVEPGLSDVFAKYASDELFSRIDSITVLDGSNLVVSGSEFAPSFSIWTTIEECLNPPIVWEKNRGLYTTDCFSEPEVFHFPAGIGPYECVNVEHEEVLLIPREIDCNRVTFKYSLGAEFIDWLKTFAYLGLDSTEHVRVGDVSVSPRDVLAAVLPNPAKLGHLMHGKTCAGTWVRGTYDGKPREVYLYHVADNETTMRDWGSQAVLWQTAICPVVALELLSNGSWKSTGVRGAEAFNADPFLNLLGDYGAHHGMVEMGPGLWPSPKPTGQPGWDRPVKRAIRLN